MTRDIRDARARIANPAMTASDKENAGGFALSPELAADTVAIGRLELCLLLLMNDATYPWFILVPQRSGIREIFELDAKDRLSLIDEIAKVSNAVDEIFTPDKLNVATIGNLVPQLHVHIVARFHSDPVWPMPMWGRTPRYPYTGAAAATVRKQLRQRLGEALIEGAC
jgi:diadenosine tetraphosphate (Ap4A) HIT family hydrolase